MADFPNTPFGTVSGLAQVLFQYPIKRTELRRVGMHKFIDGGEVRYAKGAPVVELEFTWRSIMTSWKETIRIFYDSALGDVRTWSCLVDGVPYTQCRFISGFEATEVSARLWDVTVRARGMAS